MFYRPPPRCCQPCCKVSTLTPRCQSPVKRAYSLSPRAPQTKELRTVESKLGQLDCRFRNVEKALKDAIVALGYNINHMDLAPNFAGTLMGITNCVATLAGVLAPFQAGYIINQQPSLANWRTVFLTAAGLFAAGNTVFLVFGSTNQQRWNDPLPEPCLVVEDDEELKRKARQYSVL